MSNGSRASAHVRQSVSGNVATANLASASVEHCGPRIFAAWRDLRRGGSMAALRDRLYGSGADALDPGQVDVLELLTQQASWRMSELAGALYVDASTATRAVDRLVEAELVVRRPASEDARGVVVAATPKGRRRCQRIASGRLELMHETLGDLSPEQRTALAELLERFVANVDRAADAT